MPSFPIDQSLPAITQQVIHDRALVLGASPGSGKTTRVPAALLDRLPESAGEIWVLEPRRIAARAAARFVAQERGGRLGDEVGFIVRHERKLSNATRLVFVTEGILLRRLAEDPELPGIAAVVLDEFHERHIETDLALSMLREVQQTLRPDLLLLVMSATLDSKALTRFLECSALDIPGQSFPIETSWEERRYEAPIERRIASVCERFLEQMHEADLLVFVPGKREIDAACRACASLARARNIDLLPLHAQLPAEQQDRAIRRGPRRKIVVATNVAESSITVDGVRAVIDSGLARVLRRDPRSGFDKLCTENISLASAEQRRGRAGRQGPGLCHRLWTKGEERRRPEHEDPEIRRVELSGPVLAVRAFAGRDLKSFAWFEPPEPSRLAEAEQTLRMLAALADDGSLSRLGQRMQSLPLPPRHARLVLEARELGCSFEAAAAAALLENRDPFLRTGRVQGPADLEERIEILAEAATARGDSEYRRLGLEPGATRSMLQSIRQLVGSARPAREINSEALARALLAGFPDQLARRREEDPLKGDLVTGQSIRIRPHALPESCRLFLALDLQDFESRQSARASLALPIETSWLDPRLLNTQEETLLIAKEGRVRLLRRTRYLGLNIDETLLGDAPPELARPALAGLLAKDPGRLLAKQKEFRALQARVKWLQEHAPDLDLPELSDQALIDFALQLLSSSRLDELAQLNLGPIFLAQHPGLAQSLEREAPRYIRLPSGREAKIDYSAQAGPTVSARIQELLGCNQLPRLAGGKLPIVLELLGPNYRPVQVTSDLAGFWTRSYPAIRKELKRRYPKHSWPEEPLSHKAELRPRRRRD